ncbi:hypothetical protein M3Y96_01051200 [Aphelenchoides besseyi]|nr:hypothetical protein M3Y96_01051200 [Aphelenchoides besseyi]
MKGFSWIVVLPFLCFVEVSETSKHRWGKCPSGEPAIFQCNQKTKHCDVSAKRKCARMFNGQFYCCKSFGFFVFISVQFSGKSNVWHHKTDALELATAELIRKYPPFPLSQRKDQCEDKQDCEDLKQLCNDPDVKDMMIQECAKTCEHCSETIQAATDKPSEAGQNEGGNGSGSGNGNSNASCKDRITNCDEVEDLCKDPDVKDIMLEQCAKVK